MVDVKELIGQLPSRRLENYANTPVAQLFAKVDGLVDALTVGEDCCCEQSSPCAQCGYSIRVDNGFARNKIVTLENGVVYGSLVSATEQMGEIVGKYLDAEASKSNDCYSKLCQSMASDGAFVYVPAGVDMSEPINILSCYCGTENQASFERHLIIVEQGAKAHIVFEKKQKKDNQAIASEIAETFVGEGAMLEVANICDMPSGKMVSHYYVNQSTSSNYTSVDMGVAAGLLRVNRIVNLNQEQAHCGMYGLFVSGAGELFDYHTSINHNAANCTSDEHYKDLIDQGGVGVFRGRIYVAQDAQKTEAIQQNNNILLANGAKIFTKPELEIYADDVQCTHGATIGRPDDDAIYYMRQRGIGEQMARRLQMIGFVHDIIGHCSISCVVDTIVDKITEKIENI